MSTFVLFAFMQQKANVLKSGHPLFRLTPLLHSNFNDVDFSMKIRGAGYRIVWTPYAELYHFESQTRVPTPADYEHMVIRNRWSDKLEIDPYYNPNLLPKRDDWVERALR